MMLCAAGGASALWLAVWILICLLPSESGTLPWHKEVENEAAREALVEKLVRGMQSGDYSLWEVWAPGDIDHAKRAASMLQGGFEIRSVDGGDYAVEFESGGFGLFGVPTPGYSEQRISVGFRAQTP